MRSKPPSRPGAGAGGARSGAGAGGKGPGPRARADKPRTFSGAVPRDEARAKPAGIEGDPRRPGARGPGAKGGGFPSQRPVADAPPARAKPAPRPRPPAVLREPSLPHAPRPAAAPQPCPEQPRPEPAQEPQARAPRPERSLTDPAARAGLWLYGQHAVAAALANPARRLRRLMLTEEAEAALQARQPLPWPLAPEHADRARIDRLLGGDAVHGGVALLADPLAPPALSDALERPGPVLVLDQVTDPRNIGAVLRSAAAFGAACVITQDRNAPDETGVLAKAASGALESVPLLRAVNLARTLVALKAAGYWVVGLDAAGAPLLGPALAERRVALVLGAEGAGLRRLTRETCDELAGLAMPGLGANPARAGLDSLNVSAAATVALYELARRG